MPDTQKARMYGVTCPLPGHGDHVVRLGKIWLPLAAQDADLRNALGIKLGMLDCDECPQSGTGVQFSLDQVRFVGDEERPAYVEITPSLV